MYWLDPPLDKISRCVAPLLISSTSATAACTNLQALYRIFSTVAISEGDEVSWNIVKLYCVLCHESGWKDGQPSAIITGASLQWGEFSMWPFEGKSEFILSCVYGNVLSELFASFQQMLKLVVVHAGFGIVPWCNACLQVSPFTACTRQCEYCAVFLWSAFLLIETGSATVWSLRLQPPFSLGYIIITSVAMAPFLSFFFASLWSS